MSALIRTLVLWLRGVFKLPKNAPSKADAGVWADDGSERWDDGADFL
jgi:hypothetical protein